MIIFKGMKSDFLGMSKKQILVLLCLVGTLLFFLLTLLSLFFGFPQSILAQGKIPKPWPPLIAHSYPDLELIDQEGEPFKLSYLKGKVIVIQPVAMNNSASQGYSGAEDKGSFEKVNFDSSARSFRKIFTEYTQDLVLPHPDLVFIQILLYDMEYEAPKPLHAKIWAEHFDLRREHNHFVAVSKHRLGGSYANDMIPGFQLIDRDFILRADSTGDAPYHDLRYELIPMTTKLLSQKAQSPSDAPRKETP